jgi:hypothetical protein
MGSVSSTNPSNTQVLADLLKTLTSKNSPLASTFASPAVQEALKNAPTADIVQLSEQALQLQATNTLFGQPGESNTASDNLLSVLSAISSSSTSGSTSPTAGSSLADQLAALQANTQLEAAQTLLGITPTATKNHSRFDVFA